MKVLFVATVYRHLIVFHIPYMKLLQSKGYDVWAAGFEEDNEKKELLDLGFKCVDIPFSRSPLKYKNLIAIRKMKELFQLNEFKLVHVHTPVASFITRFAFHRSENNGEIIYSVHGYHFYKGAPLKNWLIFYPLEMISARWTDYLITTNKEDFERAKKMGYKKESVHYVTGVGVNHPNEIIDDSWKKTFKSEYEINSKSVVISYIAELNKNKNHDFILKNWTKIKEICPNAVLLIIGTGIEERKIKETIKVHDLRDIIMLGYRNDVAKILAISDIVSLLSFREGLPKSIMEAMINKIPCIVSDTRGLRDLVDHNMNGYIVSKNNNEELVKAFVKLINNRDIRIDMGLKGLEKVENYTLKNTVIELNKIYEKSLNRNKKKV